MSMSAMAQNDLDLWDRIRHDDRRAFDVLRQRYQPTIEAYVRGRLGPGVKAEAVITVTFLEAWRERDIVELSEGSMLPWLYGVSYRSMRCWRRTRRRYAGQLAGPDARSAGDRHRPRLAAAQAAETDAHAARMRDVSRMLPRREREAWLLWAIEGLDHEQIAVVLGTTAGPGGPGRDRVPASMPRAVPPRRRSGHFLDAAVHPHRAARNAA
jgi:RNA polymerase sigma-70 factor (ECF subfamily)